MRTEFSGYGDPTGGTTPEHYPFEPVHGQTGCYHCGYALGHHPTLAVLKSGKSYLRPGQVVKVTNHYIDRVDHPCFGTNERTILRVTTSHIWFDTGGNVPWPKASQVRLTDNGRTLKLFGGGVGQQPTDLFLTIDLGVQS